MPPGGSICKGEISDVFVRAMQSHLMAKDRDEQAENSRNI